MIQFLLGECFLNKYIKSCVGYNYYCYEIVQIFISDTWGYKTDAPIESITYVTHVNFATDGSLTFQAVQQVCMLLIESNLKLHLLIFFNLKLFQIAIYIILFMENSLLFTNLIL